MLCGKPQLAHKLMCEMPQEASKDFLLEQCECRRARPQGWPQGLAAESWLKEKGMPQECIKPFFLHFQ